MPRIALTVIIDTDRPLGPQVAPARAQGIPWKILEHMTGRTRRGLSKMLSSSQLWERQVVSLRVLNAPSLGSDDQSRRVSSLDTGPAASAAGLLPEYGDVSTP